MADPLLYPDNQAAYLRGLEERVARLEATNRLLSSSILNGALTVYDGLGVVQIKVGAQGDGSFGITAGVNDPLPGLKLDDVNGISYPQIPLSWAQVTSAFCTSDAFDVVMFEISVVGIAYKGIYVKLTASTDVGTTGQIRLGRNASTGNPAKNTSFISVPSNSFLLPIEFWWLHQGTLGQTYKFTVNAQRTSGAGNFLVDMPLFCALIGPQHCSNTGAFVP